MRGCTRDPLPENAVALLHLTPEAATSCCVIAIACDAIYQNPTRLGVLPSVACLPASRQVLEIPNPRTARVLLRLWRRECAIRKQRRCPLKLQCIQGTGFYRIGREIGSSATGLACPAIVTAFLSKRRVSTTCPSPTRLVTPREGLPLERDERRGRKRAEQEGVTRPTALQRWECAKRFTRQPRLVQ